MKKHFPLSNKNIAILCAIWCVLVITVVITFEPYGNNISGREWDNLIAILFFPSLALAIINFLLGKFFEEN